MSSLCYMKWVVILFIPVNLLTFFCSWLIGRVPNLFIYWRPMFHFAGESNQTHGTTTKVALSMNCAGSSRHRRPEGKPHLKFGQAVPGGRRQRAQRVAAHRQPFQVRQVQPGRRRHLRQVVVVQPQRPQSGTLEQMKRLSQKQNKKNHRQSSQVLPKPWTVPEPEFDLDP